MNKTIHVKNEKLCFDISLIELTAPPAENVDSERAKHCENIYGFWPWSTPGELRPYGLLSKFRSPPRQQEA